ncbi:MAG: isoleucyl-tRNA synthetase [Parcubacteria group bacterium Gr01-1014_46]|nr:MAG: isoleucyl-tRNA synthetase [Parcubacteria group bacterium Gr01-1014_46]
MVDKETIEKSDIALKEEKILDFWNEKEIFKKTLEKDSPKGEFVFYDGPVTSNAKPVFHTMEPFAFKDIIPRYRTMQGFHVRRKGGWDTHGLPVELQIEKKLGFKSKKDIEDYGIAEFNKLCKESVWEYIELWKSFTRRMAYWADQDNAYVTYENSYIESIWNILKTVEQKKFLYKDYKVLPWCPRCGTALSSHELAQGYQDDKDLSVYANFKIKNPEKLPITRNSDGSVYLIAWTTTPWTLPGNVGLAVNDDVNYHFLRKGSDIYIVSDKAYIKMFNDGSFMIQMMQDGSTEIKGSELVGLEYEPLYSFMKEKFQDKNPEAFEKAYKVYSADFVTTEDGTGVVHTAVMYGQDDFVLGTQIGLPKYHLVKDDGRFLDGMDFLSDRFVKDEEVAVDIIKDLAHRGLLFKKEKFEHSYPHCWRCKTPLIYYARDSWYIAMSKLRDELVKENEGIGWEPAHIREGRFGEWLREIKDWAISRERYWGTPLPVWQDKDGNRKVIGSIEELKKYSKKSGNKYFIVRHGEGEHNIANILSSKKDDNFHLTEKGKKQVVEAIELLKEKGITKIISSPFVRTTETAKMILDGLSLDKSKLTFDERLSEHNLGVLSGKSVDEYHKIARTGEQVFDTRVEGGESLSDVKVRTGQFLYETDNNNKNETILIITHEHTSCAIESAGRGLNKKETVVFGNDNQGEFIKNAEIHELDFVQLPHNENYELDLHRPFIDEVKLVDEDGNELTRSKEVLDVWFDSGAMPFAQDHYPWQNGELLYPADFISEAIDQTRGWFYTLHAIGILMGKGKSFKNVICLGHILDKDGKKMSKSLGNILDPWTVMDKYGVDALRLWMYTVNSPGDSKNFDEKTVDEIVKKVFNPLLNIVAFYELYKDGTISPHNKSQNVLDKWILSRLNELVANGTKSLEKYQVFESARPIRDFVNDFSTWYVRRSRDRFKSDNTEEKKEALATTSFVLLELAKYMAPFTPFFAEEVYQKMRTSDMKESVHLENWSECGEIDSELIENMEKVRETVTSALELRQKSGHKVRQPLASLQVPIEFSKELLDIIADEVNVKEVKVGEKILLDTNLTDGLVKEGVARDIIRAIQDARKTEKLSPSDAIKIVMCTDKDGVVNEYLEMIKTPTGVTGISYSKDKQMYPVDLGSGETTFSIQR